MSAAAKPNNVQLGRRGHGGKLPNSHGFASNVLVRMRAAWRWLAAPSVCRSHNDDSFRALHEHRGPHALLAYWEHLLGDRHFPALSDVKPSEIESLWPFCVVINVATCRHGAEFEYVGSALEEGYRLMQMAAVSGMSLGETVFGSFVSLGHRVLAERAPALDSGSFRTLQGNTVDYHIVVAPLSDDQKSINYLLGLVAHLKTYDAAGPALTSSTRQAT